jgi:DNA-binding HxlR family transcriptional regulator
MKTITMKDFRIEKEMWINLANYEVWSILKLLSTGEKKVRDFMEAGLSPNVVLKYLNSMIQWGLVNEKWERNNRGIKRRIIFITERGQKLLNYYDAIGEIVKEIRQNIKNKNQKVINKIKTL